MHNTVARAGLLACSALATTGISAKALAQDAPESFGVTDIIVTAQKREQSLQDVPIAITAVTQETLQVNRVTNVSDLNAIAPNLTVLTTAGGAGIPTFGMRGLVSAGSVSGQDKSVSIYLDGVSIGSALGSTFDLPDVERIEVLRGPQGTLFGRNSTGGAISVITREPSGELGLRQEVGYGNLNQLRTVTRVNLPTMGAFSASVSYTHNELDGDVKNLAAGTVWDRRNAGMGIKLSPKTLGAKNKESVFVAAKFEPSDTFKTVYRFDYISGTHTADGGVLAVFNPSALGPLGATLQAYFNAHPSPIAGAKRPKVANAGFTVPGYQKVYGHNLTSNLILSDSLSLKSILSYRKSYIFNASDLTGIGGLVDSFGIFGPAGGRFVLLASQVENNAKQWSAELQANYDSDFLTLTAGVNYFRYKAVEGAPLGIQRVIQFANIPNGVLGAFPPDYNALKTKSLAGYVQAEVHVTPQLDVIGGLRVTNDKKDGTNFIGGSNRSFSFTYDDTRANYSIGVNYKPNADLLLY
ncbi:MAG TPA: TonB-dependent receptor, partial [Novosphingobium sp.]|nr:TonB-dependent receptor [Novosphingobium sp.]